MTFLELARKRYSCRNYQDKKVEKEKLDIILEAGRVAPTAVNFQPQRLLVITKAEGLEKAGRAARIFGAPLIIIVCTDKDTVWTRKIDQKKTTDIDASIITDHMMLAATELGLGSVWICNFNAEVLKNEFKIPDNYEPVNILALGYEAGEGKSPDRHDEMRFPIEQTVFYESYEK